MDAAMYEGRVPTDTVWDLVARRARLSGDEPLVTFVEDGRSDELWSWAHIAHRAEALAARLAELGVASQAPVALFGLNSVEYIVALAGLARLGAVAVPLNALLTPREIAWQLSDVRAAAVVAEVEGAKRMDEAAAATGFTGPRLSLRGEADGWEAMPVAGTLTGPPPQPTDVFEILYTSGTTGHPKGVMLTHRSMAVEADNVASYWAGRPDDVFLAVLPLFHINAQLVTLFPALATGARLVVTRSFSARAWIDLVRTHGVTVSSMVGTQVRMLMATPARPTDADNRLRCIPYGLNVPLEMWTAFEQRFGAPLCNIYGLTEAVAIASAAPLYGDRRIPSVGRPARGKTIGVFAADGTRLPPGADGEIRIHGQPGVSLMLGYHNRPEETAQALGADGWLRTGDIGRLDEDGYLTFVDRGKDMIKRAGENVSASEVEMVVGEFPGVAEVAVVGRADPVRDEAVVAFVVPVPGAGLDTAALDAHCRAGLARFKVPEEYRVVEALPRTSIGKVEKKTLRAQLEGETEQ
ncbi:MAG TPA: AMP-binding protein [Acidimicrobiia bacterium]|jgi:crotonobetaine/carnitine-CoA ligase